MNFLPYSNGIHPVNMKIKKSPKQKFKLIVIILIALITIGFVVQSISNFLDKERLKKRVNYTTVNDVRMDYRIKGEGSYTIVFDGALGANLEEWTPIVNELIENDDVRTFVYNRYGYGYSGLAGEKTPEEQAQDLKILLRKAGLSGKFILVGEEYGSLVLTSFAEQFPDSVSGVVLVDPINENEIKTEEYRKSNRISKIRRSIEKLGSNFALTLLLDKLNLDVNLTDLENGLLEDNLDEFLTLRTKKEYTTAVNNELNNLIKGNSDSQQEGMFSDIPYFLLTRYENDPLLSLGIEDLTMSHVTTNEQEFLPLNDKENVIGAIRQIIKKLQDIEIRNR